MLTFTLVGKKLVLAIPLAMSQVGVPYIIRSSYRLSFQYDPRSKYRRT